METIYLQQECGVRHRLRSTVIGLGLLRLMGHSLAIHLGSNGDWSDSWLGSNSRAFEWAAVPPAAPPQRQPAKRVATKSGVRGTDFGQSLN